MVEAQLKAERRAATLDRANKMMYETTDKVKAFHRTLLLSDVLAERQQQISYKARERRSEGRSPPWSLFARAPPASDSFSGGAPPVPPFPFSASPAHSPGGPSSTPTPTPPTS